MMNITFKAPEDETKTHTHVCFWVDSGAMQGYQYITLKQAGDLLNQLQQVIWQAEIPVPEVEE
jgi:hypothetical protein